MDKYNQRWMRLINLRGWSEWGITFGQVTYFSCPESEVNEKWHKHENRHKQQYAAFGIIGFLSRYAYYTVRFWGYRNNPLEVEARNAEKV